MSTLVRFVNTLTTLRSGTKLQFGEVEDPFEMAMSTDCVAGTITIAASGSAELFDGSETDPFTTASVVWIQSDRDCAVQLTFDTAGVAGKEVHTRMVYGSDETGVMGPPLFDADCRAYANYTEDFAGGTLVYVDRITVKNLDDTYSAQVKFFIGD